MKRATRRKCSSMLILTAVILALVAAPHAVDAADAVWSGGSGSWNDGARWSTSSEPASGDTVTIPPSAGDVVTLATAATVQSIAIGAGSSLVIDAAGAGFTVSAGYVSNSGTLELTNSQAGSAGILLSVGSVLGSVL